MYIPHFIDVLFFLHHLIRRKKQQSGNQLTIQRTLLAMQHDIPHKPHDYRYKRHNNDTARRLESSHAFEDATPRAKRANSNNTATIPTTKHRHYLR
jgi:transcriptional regulator of NAD metabolism